MTNHASDPARKTKFKWASGIRKFTWGVDPESDVAVYVQIEETIITAIASGRLREGDRLPPIGPLSIGLDINPNTVAKSYRDVEVMGMVYSRRGVGVYVHKKARGIAQKYCREQVQKRASELVDFAADAGMLRVVGGVFDAKVAGAR